MYCSNFEQSKVCYEELVVENGALVFDVVLTREWKGFRRACLDPRHRSDLAQHTPSKLKERIDVPMNHSARHIQGF